MAFYALKGEKCAFVPHANIGIIIDWDKKTYYLVNETGVIFLDSLKDAWKGGGGVSPETLKLVLQAFYRGVRDEDVTDYLKRLKDADLIKEMEGEALSPPPTYPWKMQEYKSPTLDEGVAMPQAIAQSWPIFTWGKIFG